IEQAVGQVNQDVHDEDGDGRDHDGGEHHVEVALQDGVDHQLADAGKAENRFNDYRAVEHGGGLVANHGDDGQHSIAQCVDEDQRQVLDALGAGGFDVGG